MPIDVSSASAYGQEGFSKFATPLSAYSQAVHDTAGLQALWVVIFSASAIFGRCDKFMVRVHNARCSPLR